MSMGPEVRGKTFLVKVLAQNEPDVRPLYSDPSHIVVRDLNKLLQTE